MLIVWGTRVCRRGRWKRLEFCPVCRDVCEFRCRRFGRHRHLYYIQMSRVEHLADEAKCPRCRSLFGGVPGRFGGPRGKDSDQSALESRARVRLALEMRARGDKATPDERVRVLGEAIEALDYAHALDIQAGRRRSVSSVVQLLALVASGTMIISVGLCFQMKPDPATKWVAAVSTLVAMPLVALVVVRARNDGRAVARKFLRPIARSVRALRPTLEELEMAIAREARRGNQLAASLSPAELHDRVQVEALKI